MGKNDELAEQILRIYAEARVNDGVIFMTYGDLATRLGRPGQHRLLGDPLDRLRRLCETRDLPDVATMIVDKPSLHAGKVEPSPKALKKYGGWLDLRAEQARVIAYDWSSLCSRGRLDANKPGKFRFQSYWPSPKLRSVKQGAPMSILSRLFGGGAKRETPETAAETYKGFRIVPAPQEAEGGYRIGARIEKEIGGEAKVQHLMRADVLGDRDAAEAASLRKAKQVIDEQGDSLFG